MKEEENDKLVRETEQLRQRMLGSSKRSSSAAQDIPLNPFTLAHHLGLDHDNATDPIDEGDATMEDSDTVPTIKAILELAALRLEHATLLDAHGTTLAELTAVRRERDAIREGSNGIRKPKAEVTLSDRVETSNLRIRLRLKDEELQAATKELTFLEMALAQLTADSNSRSDPNAISSMREARVQQLEGLLSEAKRSNAQLRSEMDAVMEKLKQCSEQTVEAEEKAWRSAKESALAAEKSAETIKGDLTNTTTELRKEKEKSEQLEKTLDRVEQELFDLRGEVAGGRHIPPNTRILELKDNPHAEWETSRTAALDRLKGENQALLKRLSEVGEALKEAANTPAPTEVSQSADATSTLVPRESLDLVVKEKDELEMELKQREKRLLRLQQVFKVKSAEFREAIESIMGVKLAFYPNGQVRITSLYDLNASFVFSPDKTAKSSSKTEGGGMSMQLVATGEGGPQDLPNMMHYWIETEGCLPGFLASVTLECYESSKRDKS
ncbi:hypothetical protein D9757_008873 [Collybiopsis confluens]|uniref:Spindle assembly checkpoint component MAD1 n=1 Tax=Collybiopsis confluens TaxID=2823264 RepID=A0A8H5M156_9AGAR|nr:hypothetical protein D9757_008873 [Collybiopsis confluens]